jgi:hypothetical protein
MCCFAFSTPQQFSIAMLSYVGATAGLIEPRPKQESPFNLDACFTMVTELPGHERIVEVRM